MHFIVTSTIQNTVLKFLNECILFGSIEHFKRTPGFLPNLAYSSKQTVARAGTYKKRCGKVSHIGPCGLEQDDALTRRSFQSLVALHGTYE